MRYKTSNQIFLDQGLINGSKNSKICITDSAILKSDYWQKQAKELISILTENSVIIGGRLWLLSISIKFCDSSPV
ncbi:hypothetical protein LEP1GSC132_3141 [Leptospira kirschneri str. 200803703]|nr:hypothetical protein LEP1GSC132_3141 [Leptospira kirschneri str. 200803703]EMO77965.1 hypothetical protein LEP1GSC127_3619 [Leptospira kirschneri str. 200801925]